MIKNALIISLFLLIAIDNYFDRKYRKSINILFDKNTEIYNNLMSITHNVLGAYVLLQDDMITKCGHKHDSAIFTSYKKLKTKNKNEKTSTSFH